MTQAGHDTTDARHRTDEVGGRMDILIRAALSHETAGPAVIAHGEALSRSSLLARASVLSRRLVEHGARPGRFVAVVADRSPETVVGIIGVVLSGAAYVPIDPAFPRARLAGILSQAAITLVTGGQVLCQGDLAREFALTAVPVPPPGTLLLEATHRAAEPEPTDPVYAIFTSGSTGPPKGVVVSHRALVASTVARFSVFRYDSMTYLALAPLTFNAAAAGLYFGLAAGGTVVLPSEATVRDPGLIGAAITDHSVTHLDAVPSQYAAVLEFAAPALTALICVVVAGEALPQALVERHAHALPEVSLFNEYGATETTVWAAVHRCRPGDPGLAAPIGVPVPGMSIDILDEALDPVAAGAVGQIAVSGDHLADGYLGDPDGTAKRFRTDLRTGRRVYLTGDLGCIDQTGLLRHCGRMGAMVKVRGHRVEITEVEAHLRAQSGVIDAVVLPEEVAGTTRLVAALVRSPGHDGPEPRAALAERLPSYMIPSRWRDLASMPMTVNGKIDRAAVAVLVGVTQANIPAPPR